MITANIISNSKKIYSSYWDQRTQTSGTKSRLKSEKKQLRAELFRQVGK